MTEYRVAVRFDKASQKYYATSSDVPGLELSDMNLERLFAKAAKLAPDLLQAAGKPADGFNLKFERSGDL